MPYFGGERMKVFIDLFSGLGGASAAFDDDPNWHVIKIDNNPELLEHNRGLHIMDISETDEVIRMLEHMLSEIGHRFHETLVIWASPPCTEFSYARKERHTQEEFDLSLIEATFDLVNHFQPDYCILENVRGAVPIFHEEFGITPRQQIGSVILWGEFPLIPIRARDQWIHRKLDAKGTRKLRPNNRALIPRPISDGLLDVLSNQTNLDYWINFQIDEES